MFELVSVEIKVKGPEKLGLPLDQPLTNLGWYRDIAIMAFPDMQNNGLSSSQLRDWEKKSLGNIIVNSEVLPDLKEDNPEDIIKANTIVNLKKDIQMVRELNSQWQVSFDPKWGGPIEPVIFNHLSDWSTNDEPSIKYYSGTAVYRTSFEIDESIPSETIFLDLGSVEIIARVKLNGQDCGIAWKPPYKVNVTDALREGKNQLEISVVNLWTNQLIGDEQLPKDAMWMEVPEGNWKDCLALYEWPEWFKTSRNRTSGRYTFTSCIHYRKDSPLVPSGLLGPVCIQWY